MKTKGILLIINHNITVVLNDLLCIFGEDKVQNDTQIWGLGNLGKRRCPLLKQENKGVTAGLQAGCDFSLGQNLWVFQKRCQWTVGYTPLLVIEDVGMDEIIQRKFKKIEI